MKSAKSPSAEEKRSEATSITSTSAEVPPEIIETYRDALSALNQAQVPFVVEGSFAIYFYCGIWRDTKDIDIFLEEANLPAARAALEQAGFHTEVTDACWLAKAIRGDRFIDIIFGSGNRVAKIDRQWIKHARAGEICGESVLVASPEDTIRFKTYVQERHRYDGADIIHIIERLQGQLDWHYLIDRMAEHWPLLYGHLINFFFVFPSRRDYVPDWVYEELNTRLMSAKDSAGESDPVCRGTLISRFSYHADLAHGYRDARKDFDANFSEDE